MRAGGSVRTVLGGAAGSGRLRRRGSIPTCLTPQRTTPSPLGFTVPTRPRTLFGPSDCFGGGWRSLASGANFLSWGFRWHAQRAGEFRPMAVVSPVPLYFTGLGGLYNQSPSLSRALTTSTNIRDPPPPTCSAAQYSCSLGVY